MNPRKIAITELEQNGYFFKRHGRNHDIYYNNKTGIMIPLKRHDFNENDLHYIIREIRHAGKEQSI